MFRRVVLTLTLVLFATITIGAIVGLDEAARSNLVHAVTGSPAPQATPTARPTAHSTRPSARAIRTPSALPRRAATATPTPEPPTATRPPAAAKPTASAKSAPRTKPSASAQPKATSKPRTHASPKATSTSSPKATSTSKPKATSKPKPAGSPYLTGPLRKGSGGTVYLTFDDGPGPATPAVLAILSRTGSTATFFQLGTNTAAYPGMAARVRAQGSRVGNHSYDHPDLTRLTKSQVRWQLAHGPSGRCFRPPYGATDAAVRAAIARAGMRQVLWSVDTLDWSRPGTATLAKTGRLKTIRSGSIILMHDGGGDRSQTVAALPRIIADLHARGYRVRALPYC